MEPPSSRRVSVTNQSGIRLPSDSISNAVEKALYCLCADGEVSILLADDETVTELNRRFRGIAESTDVLSFSPAEGPNRDGILGDIAIAVPYAKRQAELRGVGLETELEYLALHGLLHLLGWEDETDRQRAEMMAEMDRVGQAIGLPAEPEWSSILHGESA